MGHDGRCPDDQRKRLGVLWLFRSGFVFESIFKKDSFLVWNPHLVICNDVFKKVLPLTPTEYQKVYPRELFIVVHLLDIQLFQQNMHCTSSDSWPVGSNDLTWGGWNTYIFWWALMMDGGWQIQIVSSFPYCHTWSPLQVCQVEDSSRQNCHISFTFLLCHIHMVTVRLTLFSPGPNAHSLFNMGQLQMAQYILTLPDNFSDCIILRWFLTYVGQKPRLFAKTNLDHLQCFKRAKIQATNFFWRNICIWCHCRIVLL